MTSTLRKIFDQSDDSANDRAKYLSRLFGIFSERVVSIWARDENSSFLDLGRPTLKTSIDDRGYTLDFTLKDRSTGKIYAAEMKCEIEYQNFRYFILSDSSQLDHHRKPAFKTFLEAARFPKRFLVNVKGQKIKIDGAILVWGAIASQKKKQLMRETGIFEILTIEEICQDLITWENQEYREMVEKYREWSNRLFDGLISKG